MFDSLPNLLFLLIPLAIFIGRMIIEARKKGEGNPLNPRNNPLHFEDKDEEDESPRREHIPVPVPAPVPKPPSQGYKSFLPNSETLFRSGSVAAASPVIPVANNALSTAPVRQKSLPVSISRLSPMKQAVVMAEVLGTPKGLQ